MSRCGTDAGTQTITTYAGSRPSSNGVNGRDRSQRVGRRVESCVTCVLGQLYVSRRASCRWTGDDSYFGPEPLGDLVED